ncbi:MAG: undecaprenyl-diphosphate phosphatase [Candidatus Magasanikbacteria bacterium]
MSILQAIVLGIIQGLTEFLPVSSSGHLIFLPKLFGWADQGLAFDTFIHLGTLVAVVVYFRKKLLGMLKSVLLVNSDQGTGSSNRKLAWLIILSIIPAGIVGILFDSWIEENLRATWIIGVNFIVWGVVLFIADRVQRTTINNQQSLEKVNWRTALFIGCAQAVALVPGTSRSGITMTAGLFSKLDKKSAAEFSFLMSVPIITLAGGMQLIDMIKNGFEAVGVEMLIAGFVASAISGLLAIWGLMKIIQKWSFLPFVVYRVIIGVLILLFL